jgi:hypothetical protein
VLKTTRTFEVDKAERSLGVCGGLESPAARPCRNKWWVVVPLRRVGVAI